MIEVNVDDIMSVFQYRHNLKVTAGLNTAVEALDELYQQQGDTVGLLFNLGLCLYEIGDKQTARTKFFEAISHEDAYLKLGNFVVDAVELLFKSNSGSINGSEIGTIVNLVKHFDVHQRERLITYLVFQEQSAESLDLIWNVIRLSESSALHVPLRQGLLQKFFARCSSQGREAEFLRSLHDKQMADLEGTDDLLLIRLLHTTMPPDEWLASAWTLVKGDITSRNAMDLALIAISTQNDKEAGKFLENLAEQKPNYWGVVRTLGAMSERAGNLDAALSFYEKAALNELQFQDLVDSLSTHHQKSPKISAIALSFNDGPLVNHFCRMVSQHCDEIIVNDGGSSDDTVSRFQKFSTDTGIPVHVIEDVQHGNKDRTIFNKEGYRSRNLGGVLAFDADRRRTTTIVHAEHEFLLMLDLDDYLPPFPNLKTLVQASPYVQHFAGARLEVIGNRQFTALHLGSNQACPSLFQRHKKHVYGGVNGGDEYLARLDRGIDRWAMTTPHVCLTDCYNYWHLKHVLDSRSLSSVRPGMGAAFNMALRYDRPLSSTLPNQVSSKMWGRDQT